MLWKEVQICGRLGICATQKERERERVAVGFREFVGPCTTKPGLKGGLQELGIYEKGVSNSWSWGINRVTETGNDSFFGSPVNDSPPHVSASSHPVARPFSLGNFQGALLQEEKWWQQ